MATLGRTTRKTTTTMNPSPKTTGSEEVTKVTKVSASRGANTTEDRNSQQQPQPLITPETRRVAIEQAAYFRAASRNFQNGDPTQDWLNAEREIDSQLLKHAR